MGRKADMTRKDHGARIPRPLYMRVAALRFKLGCMTMNSAILKLLEQACEVEEADRTRRKAR